MEINLLLMEVMCGNGGKLGLVEGDEEVGKEKRGLKCNLGRTFERDFMIDMPIG